jgi:hypothetical protein
MTNQCYLDILDQTKASEFVYGQDLELTVVVTFGRERTAFKQREKYFLVEVDG